MNYKTACTGFFAGAVAGVAIAMLYAPHSGAETRRRILETGRGAGTKAKGALEGVKCGVEKSVTGAVAKVTDNAERVVANAERVVSKVTDNAGRVVNAVDAGREAFRASMATT